VGLLEARCCTGRGTELGDLSWWLLSEAIWEIGGWDFLCGYCVDAFILYFCIVINMGSFYQSFTFFTSLPTNPNSCKRAQRDNKRNVCACSSSDILHVQLNDIAVELVLVLLERGLDLCVDELLDNLGRAADEAAGVGQAVDLGEDGLEERRDLDALDQVVVLALLLDDGAGLVGEHADLLVGVLAGVALLDHGHDDVLGCHLEGRLVVC